MGFHRLTVPSYFGGLPGGVDYLNNAVVGTPAVADGPRAQGANAGTYLVGHAEDATSRSVNRGLRALGENTDILDNVVRRDVAEPQVTVDAAVVGVPLASIVVTGPIFVGLAGTTNNVAGIATFLTLVDSEDNEIYDAGNPCQITAIAGATPGGEWSAGNVTLTISPAIPVGVVYRVYYNTRANYTTLPADFHIKNRRRYRRYNGGPNWLDGTTNPPTYITNQLDKLVTDLSASAGSERVGAAAIAGATYALTAGSVRSQLAALLAVLNADNAVRTISGSTTLATTDKHIVYAGTGLINFTLCDPALVVGRAFHFYAKTVGTSSQVTLVRFGAERISSVAKNYVFPIGSSWTLVSDGTDWYLNV